MATRSTISLKTESGYKTIYCHWDGQLDHNGNLLKEHYNTHEKVEELIALGALSFLNKRVKPEEGVPHTFHKPAAGVTVAYHRDRAEGKIPTIDTRDTLRDIYRLGEDYNYVFEGNEWFVIEEKRKEVVLKSL